MQFLLVKMDVVALTSEWQSAHAAFLLSNRHCALYTDLPIPAPFESVYST